MTILAINDQNYHNYALKEFGMNKINNNVDPRFIASMLTSDPSEVRAPRILSEADMPPPAPPAQVRAFDGDEMISPKAGGFQVNFGGKENRSLGSNKFSSQKSPAPSKPPGMQMPPKTGNKLFDQTLELAVQRKGNIEDAIRQEMAYYQPKSSDRAAFLEALRKTAQHLGIQDLDIGAPLLKAPGVQAPPVKENRVDPALIASMLTEDPDIVLEADYSHELAADVHRPDRCSESFNVDGTKVTIDIWYKDTEKGCEVSEWEISDASGPNADEACDKLTKAIESGKINLESICEKHCEPAFKVARQGGYSSMGLNR